MKTKIQTLTRLRLATARQVGLAAILLSGIFTTSAQTVTTTNPPSVTAGFSQILQAIGNAAPTNYAVAPYLTYAPKAPTKVGGGLIALYNVNNYVGAGLGMDWLGSFNLVSGNIQLKLPTHPLKFLKYSWTTNLEVTPFVLGGIGTPFGGAGSANGGISTIEDAGFNVGIGHFMGGAFDVGIAYGQWTGSGAYDVKRYHTYFGWSKGF